MAHMSHFVYKILNGKMDEIPKKPYTKWFDYDKMKKGFEIRTKKSR